MNYNTANNVPWSSPSNIAVEAVTRTTEAGRSSGTHSHYTSNGTVIHASPAEDTDRQTTSADDTGLQFPESVRLPSSVHSIPLSFASPIPASIDTVIWPHDSTSCYAVHDGRNAGPAAADASMFTPWVGSSVSARAWNAADETEAAIPTKSEIWTETRLRRYLIGISCVLYLVAAVLLIVVRTLVHTHPLLLPFLRSHLTR